MSKLTNRLSTTCDSLHHLKAIRFGKENEDVAAQLFMKYQNSYSSSGTKVLNCGLFVNPQFPWLGPSPDSLVYDPNATPSIGGLEVKCIESAQGMTPMQAYQMKRMPKEGKKKSFGLKKKKKMVVCSWMKITITSTFIRSRVKEEYLGWNGLTSLC